MTEPNTLTFVRALLSLSNLLKDYQELLDTKKGSSIRLLVIRPYAYLYSKVNLFISKWIHDTSIKTLSTSMLTLNLIADHIASNYFILRRPGIQAKGYITLHCTQSLIRVPRGSIFTIDGHLFITDKTCIATRSLIKDTDQINYIKMYLIDNKYVTSVPVQARNILYILIPSGVLCSSSSYISGLLSVLLTSPITGGNIALSDASMISRCKDRCGSSIGTLSALRLKFNLLSVPVLGLNAIGSNDAYCFRSRYNNMCIPTGNSLDLFIKTSNQSSIKTIDISKLSLLKIENGYLLRLDKASDSAVQCAIRVINVRASLDSFIRNYTVRYISGNPNISDIGARLSEDQIILIYLLMDSPADLNIDVLFMPNMSLIILLINTDSKCMIGIDYSIKSAVPVRIGIQAYLYSTLTMGTLTILSIKNDIASFINSKQVGLCNINMDQISEVILNKYTGIRLRLPYTLTASMPTIDGSNYTFNTTDGTLNIQYRDSLYHWADLVYFLSITPSDITLLVL